jgi:hypothetical protein
MMKKLFVGVSLLLAATLANANIVSGGSELVTNGVAVNIVPSDGGWGPILSIPEGGYMSGYAGTLNARHTGSFTATYLGQVASIGNFYMGNTRMNGLRNGGHIGDTNSMQVAAGQVNFGFGQDGCHSAGCAGIFHNGDVNGVKRGILFFLNTYGLTDASGHLFDFLVGYNDSAPVNNDYDDFVVGVRSVPVPAALPLLASALGMFGLSRRKSKAKVA